MGKNERKSETWRRRTHPGESFRLRRGCGGQRAHLRSAKETRRPPKALEETRKPQGNRKLNRGAGAAPRPPGRPLDMNIAGTHHRAPVGTLGYPFAPWARVSWPKCGETRKRLVAQTWPQDGTSQKSASRHARLPTKAPHVRRGRRPHEARENAKRPGARTSECKCTRGAPVEGRQALDLIDTKSLDKKTRVWT